MKCSREERLLLMKRKEVAVMSKVVDEECHKWGVRTRRVARLTRTGVAKEQHLSFPTSWGELVLRTRDLRLIRSF